MPKKGFLFVAGFAIATLLYLVYVAATFEAPTGTTTVVIPATQRAVAPPAEPRPRPVPSAPAPRALPPAQPQSTVTASAGAPVTVAPPAVEVAAPVEEIAEDLVDLPSLNASDNFIVEGLQAIRNGAALISLLADDQLARKFVVFVENVSRGEFPQSELPYKPIGQEMLVRNIDQDLFVMNELSHQRFDQFVEILTSLDTEQTLSFYRVLSPLFQQAFAEIGFRDVSFDSTLRRAITNVLQTEDVAGPYQLVKPSVMYIYADASIENLQEIHKQLIRIGPQNTEALKAKLRQFLIEL